MNLKADMQPGRNDCGVQVPCVLSDDVEASSSLPLAEAARINPRSLVWRTRLRSASQKWLESWFVFVLEDRRQLIGDSKWSCNSSYRYLCRNSYGMLALDHQVVVVAFMSSREGEKLIETGVGMIVDDRIRICCCRASSKVLKSRPGL